MLLSAEGDGLLAFAINGRRPSPGARASLLRWARSATGLTALLCLALTGCATPEPTWGERTAHLNRTFDLDGRADRRMVFRESGRPDADLTLLFLHGLGTSKFMWKDFTPAFEQDCRIVVVDLIGFGDASTPLDADYRLPSQARWVRQFAAAQKLDNVVLLGESYGGGIALEAAAQMIESGEGSRLRGLVLFGAAALYAEPVPPNMKLLWNPVLRCLLDAFVTPRGAADLILNGAYYKRERITEEARAEHARCFATHDARRVAILSALQIFEDLEARRNESDRYRAVAVPSLLVWGNFDQVIPHIVMCLLAELLPDVRLHVIPDCGHVPPGEQPEATAKVVREYLNRLRASTTRPTAP